MDLFDYVRARHPDAPWEAGGGVLLTKKTKAAAAAKNSGGDQDEDDDEKEKAEDEPSSSSSSSSRFPKHWGEEPRIQTRDYRTLPGGYGMGSSTLARWIQDNLDRDEASASSAAEAPTPGEGDL